MSFFTAVLSFYLKLFFLLTPFFIIGMFISMTDGVPVAERRLLARNVAICTMCVSLIIFLFGSLIMRLFGITVDAFRAGSGVLLMLTAIAAVNRQPSDAQKTFKFDKIQELALVPMAVPMTAGPAVLGTLMVEGTDAKTIIDKLAIILAIIMATSSIGVCLVFADKIESLLGHSRIIILSKLTGLILSAIAVQMIVVGVKSLFLSTM
jgi:multiple antibiotic resistance protein